MAKKEASEPKHSVECVVSETSAPKHSVECVVSEKYKSPDDGVVRLSIDGELMRVEVYVPSEFGDTVEMNDKVVVTIEKK